VTDDAPILDDAVLDELRASVGGDETFIADLAATFCEEGAGQMAQMEAAAAAGDIPAIVRPAHSLKSSSAALGAMRVSQIGRDIEHAGREGRAEGLNEMVDRARQAWDLTMAELRERGLVK
jgi:HPt (histidine-containing phosphotransfer) domain-containing protein